LGTPEPDFPPYRIEIPATRPEFSHRVEDFQNFHGPLSVTFLSLHGRGSEMGPESDELSRLSILKVCPNCGKQIPAGTAVVRAGGTFCGLDCVASYFAAEFKERARRLEIASRQ